jgi:hypothetical protein
MPSIVNLEIKNLKSNTLVTGGKLTMSDQEMEDLRQQLAEKKRKIRHLEDDLRRFIRNPYVNSDNISGSIAGGAFLIGIPILLVLNHFSGSSESGTKMILGFVAGATGTSIGAYLYHRSVKVEQDKRWRQLDISPPESEEITLWM